jgi:hypothetical protein
VVAGSYLLGPMSVPSNSRNLTSIGSFPPAIFPAGWRRKIPTTAAATGGRLSRPRPAEESGSEKLPNSRQQGQETDADPTKYPLSPLVKQEFRILSWRAKRRDGRLEGRGGEGGRSGIPRCF